MRGISVVVASVGVLAACSAGDPHIELEPVGYDFFGELAAAETAGWHVVQRDTSESAIAATDGGVGSRLLVGPATLTLDDGTVVDVPERTPGGNRCPQLDIVNEPPDVPTVLGTREACLVIGAFADGTGSAEWFVTTLVSRVGSGYALPAAGIDRGAVVVPVGASSAIRLRVAPGASELDCSTSLDVMLVDGTGEGFDAVVDGDGAVVGVQCYPDY